MSTDGGTVYVEDFDREDFLKSFYYCGIALTVSLIIQHVILRSVNFQWRLIASYIARANFDWVHNAIKFPVYVGWSSLFFFFFATLPYLAMLTWGIYVYVAVSKLMGMSMFCVGSAILLAGETFLRVRFGRWRMSWPNKLALAVAFLCVTTFQFWIAFAEEPFTYLVRDLRLSSMQVTRRSHVQTVV